MPFPNRFDKSLQQLLTYQPGQHSRNLTIELGIKDHTTGMRRVTLMWMVHTVIINEICNSCVLLLICNKNVLLLDKINQLSLCYIQFLGYLGRSGLLSLFSESPPQMSLVI